MLQHGPLEPAVQLPAVHACRLLDRFDRLAGHIAFEGLAVSFECASCGLAEFRIGHAGPGAEVDGLELRLATIHDAVPTTSNKVSNDNG